MRHFGKPFTKRIPLKRDKIMVVQADDPKHDRGEADATRIATQIAEIAGQDTRVRGPAPCPIARIADSFRFQVEVIAPSASRLQTILGHAKDRLLLEPAARIAVDVDPQSLL